ncbi:MAG: trypsin-like peptidase domain-containing protein [Planctomycetaceae bacterium]|jgi:S1-C subfamily serine protease|nr:trypsin-like peptidase domain-containing protein [Planctomycetaceae bacterium]
MFAIQAILSTLILATAPAPQDATLLFITTPNCQYCRQVTPLVKEIADMGYAVETIDASQSADFVRNQLNVSQFPTFLMIAQNRIIDRVVGGDNPITLKPRILYMFERATTSQQKNHEIVQAAFTTPENTTNPILQTNLKTNSPNINSPQINEKQAKIPANISTISTWLASSVKLRVDADNTHSWGTGTIIDTRKGEALILTCGHIFRDSKGQGKIEVHLFGQNSSVKVFGRCLCYDLEIDLALVVIVPPCPVQAVPIAPPQYQITPEQYVWSVGCDSGANPTTREHRILSTNRIGTPLNNLLPFHYIQVSGAPVSGRSGGGLFTENGYLIGVCNTADPVQNDGHFVPPSIIRHLLQSMLLSEIYEKPSLQDNTFTTTPTSTTQNLPTQNLSTQNPKIANPTFTNPIATTPTPNTTISTNSASPNLTKPLAPLKIATPSITTTVASESFAEQGIDEKQQATLDEIKRRQQDGDEVLLIVRSRRNPEMPSEFIRLNGNYNQFLDALTKPEPVANTSSYNPVIFSSHEIPNPKQLPNHSSPTISTTDRQPVSFPVLH